MFWEFVVFFFPDSAIVLQSDGVGDSNSVKENTSLLTGQAETSSTGLIIRPISGQFDDFSSGDNSLEKILPEETDNKEASWLHAEQFFVLVSMWLPQQHMVPIWTPHGIHVETMWCPVETT